MNDSIAPPPPTRDRSDEFSPVRLILVEVKRVVVNVITSVRVLVLANRLVLELTLFVRIVVDCVCVFQARCWDGSGAEREIVLLPDNGRWLALKFKRLRLADLDMVLIEGGCEAVRR